MAGIPNQILHFRWQNGYAWRNHKMGPTALSPWTMTDWQGTVLIDTGTPSIRNGEAQWDHVPTPAEIRAVFPEYKVSPNAVGNVRALDRKLHTRA